MEINSQTKSGSEQSNSHNSVQQITKNKNKNHSLSNVKYGSQDKKSRHATSLSPQPRISLKQKQLRNIAKQDQNNLIKNNPLPTINEIIITQKQKINAIQDKKGFCQANNANNNIMVIAKKFNNYNVNNNNLSGNNNNPNSLHQTLNPQDKKQQLSNQFNNAFQQEQSSYKYYLGSGNNVNLVRRIMSKREGWTESKESQTMFVQFKWQQSHRGYRYDRLIENGNYKQLVNHFENHHELSNKQYLFQNLMQYADSAHLNIFEITPLTIIIDFSDDNCEANINAFLKIYTQNIPQSLGQNLNQKLILDFKRKMRFCITCQNQQEKPNKIYKKFKIPPQFFSEQGAYLWLLKPTFLNRGRGIYVFNSISQLEKIIMDYQQGFIEKPLQKKCGEEQQQQQQVQQQGYQQVNYVKLNAEMATFRIRKNNQQPQQKASKNLLKSQNMEMAQYDQIVNINDTSKLNKSIQDVQSKLPSSNSEQNQQQQQQQQQQSTQQSSARKIIDNQSREQVSQSGNNEKPLYIQSQSQQQQRDMMQSTQCSGKLALQGSNNLQNTVGSMNQGLIKVQDQVKTSQGQQKQKQEFNGNDYIRSFPPGPAILRTNAFIIQKYIEKPLLINNRKFDIRHWVLITHEFEAYFFREGYIRTSSEQYKCDQDSIDNQFIHLTNNAVQKFSDNYGSFEFGNQISYKQFQTFLDKMDIKVNFREKCLKEMKYLTMVSLQATKKRIVKRECKFNFEIFGYDFIIDDQFKVWLIEVNTNPCIEESSPILQILLPRMLDDAFKLTIDKIFPKKNKFGFPEKLTTQTVADRYDSQKQNLAKSQMIKLQQEGGNIVQNEENLAESEIYSKQQLQQQQNSQATNYKVEGYDDKENMWEYMCNLDDQQAYQNYQSYGQSYASKGKKTNNPKSQLQQQQHQSGKQEKLLSEKENLAKSNNKKNQNETILQQQQSQQSQLQTLSQPTLNSLETQLSLHTQQSTTKPIQQDLQQNAKQEPLQLSQQGQQQIQK